MALQSSGAISFANIQTVFGGANPIGLNEYYLNASTGYTSGVSGIPNIGSSISLSQFYGKSKPVVVVDYMLSGNVRGSMSTSDNGSGMGINGSILSNITGVDDSSTAITNPTIPSFGFPFFFFGTDYGSSNTIYWSTNQVLQFGTNTGTITWSQTTGRGILLGNADRRTNSAYVFPFYTRNNHSIKRLVVNHANYYGTSGSEIQMEIRLIRGPSYQYVEIRMAYWGAGTSGNWNLTNGGGYTNVFLNQGLPPITDGIVK